MLASRSEFEESMEKLSYVNGLNVDGILYDWFPIFSLISKYNKQNSNIFGPLINEAFQFHLSNLNHSEKKIKKERKTKFALWKKGISKLTLSLYKFFSLSLGLCKVILDFLQNIFSLLVNLINFKKWHSKILT